MPVIVDSSVDVASVVVVAVGCAVISFSLASVASAALAVADVATRTSVLAVVVCSFVVCVGDVTEVVGTLHSSSKHCSSVMGLSMALHHFSSGSSLESAKHLTRRLLIPMPQVLEHDSQG